MKRAHPSALRPYALAEFKTQVTKERSVCSTRILLKPGNDGATARHCHPPDYMLAKFWMNG